jgi:hypothetical protein
MSPDNEVKSTNTHSTGNAFLRALPDKKILLFSGSVVLVILATFGSIIFLHKGISPFKGAVKKSPTPTISVSEEKEPTPTPTEKVQLTQAQKPTPTPTKKVVVPTATPTKAAATPTPTPTPTPPGPQIDSISPTSGYWQETITIKGSRFGSPGRVEWYVNNQAAPYAPHQSWSDTEIKVPSAGSGSNTTYQLKVVRSDNRESNTVSFQSTQGQPVVDALTPPGTAPGGSLTLTGSRFGSSTGTVNFFLTSGGSKTAASVSGWSETQIALTVPSSLTPNTEYYVEVVSSTGAPSSYKVYTTGN